MRYRFSIYLLLTGALILGCDAGSESSGLETDGSEMVSDTESTSQRQPDLTSGEADYARYCSICHGDNGEGYKADQANALNHPQFLATATDAFIRHAIVRGRPTTTMSSWHQDAGGPLNDDAVDDIVAYIRSWQTGESIDVHDYVPDGKEERAEAVYDIRCAGCHGEKGENGQFMSIANPEFLATASDGYLHHVLQNGRAEVGMPAFGPLLTPQQLDDLVVLIRSWQVDPEDPPEELPVVDPANFVINPSGPEPEFTLDEEGRVSVKQVEAAWDINARMVLLDARLPSEYLHGHIQGATSIPFYSAGEFVEYFDPDTWVVAYCACPHAESGEAAAALIEAGLTKVTVIDEGYDQWVEDGYPTVEGANP